MRQKEIVFGKHDLLTAGKSSLKIKESLWDAACEYFDWVEKHPLWEDKSTFSRECQLRTMWLRCEQ